MKQDYRIENEKIIVYDDIKGFLDYEYQNNIDKILIQENIVEKLNVDIYTKKMDKIQKESHFKIRYNKKVRIIEIIVSTSILALFSFGILHNFPLAAIIFTIIPSLLMNGSSYLYDLIPMNNLKKEINADTLSIEELEKLLKKEEKVLDELKNNKEKTINNQNYSFDKKENNKRLEEIDNLKKIYYTCGYYAKKLMKYQKKDILKDKLCDDFNNEELDIIENIIKEKGPQLVKRKISNN